jgi:hypothetical protein
MPRRELGRRVDALERAADVDGHSEVAELLAQLPDVELEALDTVIRDGGQDLITAFVDKFVVLDMAGMAYASAVGAAAVAVRDEAIQSGRLAPPPLPWWEKAR